MSITYHKKIKKRKRKHGFLKRAKTKGGRKIVARRRRKKRKEITVQWILIHFTFEFKLMLPQDSRLQNEKEIERVYKKGKSFKEDFLVLKVVKNSLAKSRFAFIVSQKVSKKAVARNKVKRRLRETIKKQTKIISSGFDNLVIARSEAVERNFPEIEKVLIKLLKRAKLIKWSENLF